ncbi:MAG: acetyl-CoA carboxylase biotin carboxyl carrier protein subunit [Ardenticatenaceae bacterium]
MEYRYQVGQERYTVCVVERAGGYEVCIGERRYTVRAREMDETTLDLWIEGRLLRVRHAGQEDERWLALDGAVYGATRERHRRRRHVSGEDTNTLTASMPGQIVAVQVVVGDEVERGQLLLLMEAMKMELRVTAPHEGTIRQVLVAEGEAVERGQRLVEMMT